MKRRYLTSSLLTCLVLAFFVSSAAAQNLRPEDTFFLKPRAGISNYVGDWDTNPFDFDDFNVNGKFPYSAALEVGYAFSPTFNAALAYQVADYPTIRFSRALLDSSIPDDERYGPNPGDTYTRRHTAQLLLRLQAPTRVAPFLTLGGHVTRGYSDFDPTRGDRPASTYPAGATAESEDEAEEEYTSFGPVIGLGLDFALNDRTSFILEAMTNVSFPDIAADGGDADSNPATNCDDGSDENNLGCSDGFFSNFDLMSYLGLGLKVNFSGAFTPVDIMTLDCPSTLNVGESATFSAVVNDNEATMPINYNWDFGNGATAEGLLATYSYPDEGTYTVTFEATNNGSTDTETCVVDVEEAPRPVAIEGINANPSRFDVCEPTVVQFSSDVAGDRPVEYDWDFGDGEDAEGANPSHVYDQPGTYTVTLTVENEFGTDTRTMTIRANECEPGICSEITEMNPVFFNRNSSTLTQEGREALRENIEIFEECPELCAELRGYASPTEREPQDLSEARAEAVLDFYTDNGLDDDRFEVSGEGAVGETTKKGAGSQFRRVDTIPMDCEDL